MPRVMVVDDEQDIIDSVKEILEMEGYEAVGVTSGGECLRALEKNPVDLILMDFFMPEMDGRIVIEKIRENPGLKNIKIVFLTSATFKKKGIETLKELNVSDYIMKPIEVEDFTSRIRKIIG